LWSLDHAERLCAAIGRIASGDEHYLYNPAVKRAQGTSDFVVKML
jgi:hypothetical protein